MIIGAFYTVGTPYEKEVENLRESLEKFGYTHEIHTYPTRGGWVANCAIKPEFCLMMLKKYPGEVFVYVDADAIIRRPPVIALDFKNDFAVHWRARRLLSGTLIFRSTSRVREMVQRWVDYQKINPDMWDQRTLEYVVKEAQWSDIKMEELPSSYTKIFDAKDQNPNPVIEHFQASRRFKKLVMMRKNMPRGIRIADDGTFWLVRHQTHLINWLNARYDKYPNELRWRPFFRGQSDIGQGALNGMFDGHPAYIIGKGPSLDDLRAVDFEDPEAPIFVLNEAIYHIEELGLPNPLYSVIDPPLRDSVVLSKDTHVLVNDDTHWYEGHARKYTYSTKELILSKTPLTVLISIAILKKTNMNKIILYAFDACMGGGLEYANAIGYPSTRGGDPSRFTFHRARITKVLSEIPYEFRWAKLTETFAKQQPL